MKGSQLKRMSIVIAACAALGAIAGIAGSAAAPSKPTQSQAQQKKAQRQALKQRARVFRRSFRLGVGPGPVGPGFGFGPVHAEAVIPKADGSGFYTVTTDAGTLNSVDGTTVHLKEGTGKATYKDDVAVDVGSDAKVIRNHKDAKLSDLKAGDHVRVITGTPKGNVVIAEDDAFIAQEKKRWQQFKKQFRERGFHHHGFGPPPGGVPGSYPGDDGDSGSSSGSSSGGTTNS
jgi:type II secretory pathway pseudopilin PulG